MKGTDDGYGVCSAGLWIKWDRGRVQCTREEWVTVR